eukprot:m51a1_g12123 hypothetical protein (265) ;mRNA; r:868-3613
MLGLGVARMVFMALALPVIIAGGHLEPQGYWEWDIAKKAYVVGALNVICAIIEVICSFVCTALLLTFSNAVQTAFAVLAMPAIGVGLVLHPEHACDCFALLFTYAVDTPNAFCAAVEVICSLFCIAAVISAETYGSCRAKGVSHVIQLAVLALSGVHLALAAQLVAMFKGSARPLGHRCMKEEIDPFAVSVAEAVVVISEFFLSVACFFVLPPAEQKTVAKSKEGCDTNADLDMSVLSTDPSHLGLTLPNYDETRTTDEALGDI